MSIPFAAIVTPDSIIFTDPAGKTHSVLTDNTNYTEIKTLIKEIGAMKTREKNGEIVSLAEFEDAMNRLLDLVTPAKQIVEKSDGRVTVDNGIVYYGEIPIHSALAERILWGLREGFNMDSYILFLENLMQNPSKRSVSEVYTFIERNKMGITDDGHILGYKRVRADFKDIHSGKFDNSPGKIVSMIRNQVDDDANRTCSTGLHFCSQSYLPHFGSIAGNKIVIVKVNPADVVSVPVDYNAAKVRACRYEVLGEYTGSDKDDLLSTKAVFDTDSFRDHSDDEDDSEKYIYGEDRNESRDDSVVAYDGQGTELCVGDVVTYEHAASKYRNGDKLMEVGEHFVIKDIDDDINEILLPTTNGDEWFDANCFVYSHSPELTDEPTAEPVVETPIPVVEPVVTVPPEPVVEPVSSAKEIIADARYDSGYEAGYKTSGVLDDMTLDVIKARVSFDTWSNGFVAGYKQKMDENKAEIKVEKISMPFENLPNGEILSNETINSPKPVSQPVEPIVEKSVNIPAATPLHTDMTINKPVRFDPLTGKIILG